MHSCVPLIESVYSVVAFLVALNVLLVPLGVVTKKVLLVESKEQSEAANACLNGLNESIEARKRLYKLKKEVKVFI